MRYRKTKTTNFVIFKVWFKKNNISELKEIIQRKNSSFFVDFKLSKIIIKK